MNHYEIQFLIYLLKKMKSRISPKRNEKVFYAINTVITRAEQKQLD